MLKITIILGRKAMIKFILRKTVLKQFDKQTQDHILPFFIKKYTTMWFCCFMLHFLIFIAPMLLLYLAVNGKEFDSIYSIVLGIAIATYGCILLVSYGYFYTEIINFCNYTLADKLYNRLYAQKGKAISKKDFKKIKSENKVLYDSITSSKCHGYCYATCFNLLRTLKTGNIKFMAVKLVNTGNKTEEYTMHVVYEKNGWIFDTYNQRQYPVEKSMELHDAIVYKNFSYEDIIFSSYDKFIMLLSYDEFRDKNYDELAKWCKEHNCYQEWKKDE